MKLKILIVDDEKIARKKIRLFLKKSAYQFKIEEAENGIEAEDKIISFKPNIVFLDMDISDIIGIDLIRNLKERDFKVIFQTAYSQYAVDAFAENAVDYLLKPYSYERFLEALQKAMKLFGKKKSLKKLQEKEGEKKYYKNNFKFVENANTYYISAADIFFLSKDKGYTLFHTAQREFLSKRSLNYFEECLDPELFIRIHRKYIVKISEIVSTNRIKQGLFVKLKTGEVLPVSRIYRPKLLRVRDEKAVIG